MTPSQAPAPRSSAAVPAVHHPIWVRGQHLRVLDATDGLWALLSTDQEFADGWLLSVFTYDTTWTKRERHPDADELAYIVSGAATLHLQHGDETSTTPIGEGEWAVIPRDAWHTFAINAATTILFMTPAPTATIEEPLE